jgi:RNA polymerase sigma-70 factor, ECF subfamily
MPPFAAGTTVADVLSFPPASDEAAGADALREALASGDERALRAAYRDHHAAVRAFAQRLVGDPAAAEDLVHEVFVRLPRAVRSFRGDASLRSFLVSMAINHARHHLRAATRRRRAASRLRQEPRPAAAEPPDPVERHQLAAALIRALDTLPLEQRVAFVLCEVEERTSAEAAALVGTSDGTLRARLFHARKKLRACLEQWGFGRDHGAGGVR